MSDDDRPDDDKKVVALRPLNDPEHFEGVDGVVYSVQLIDEGVYLIDGERHELHPAITALLETLLEGCIFYEREVDRFVTNIAAFHQECGYFDDEEEDDEL